MAISLPPAITPRQRYLNRHSALKQQRAGFDAHWQEIGQNFRPRRPRFNWTDRSKAGSIRNDGIINNTPLIASRTCAAGMQGGMTSPSRPWFRLTFSDSKLATLGPVKLWLHEVEESIRIALSRSNIYSSFQVFYADLADFGTAVMWVDEDDEDLLRVYTIPIGQFSLANSARLRVNTLYRSISMTTAQLVEMFGEEKCSERVRDLYRQARLDDWHNVVHAIEPNRESRPGLLGPDGMAYKSCWLEENGDVTAGFLRESGYQDCPFLACRWDATSEDVYGYGPGMDALGDAKGLQDLESDKLIMVEKLANPPVTAPTSMQQQPISLVPGKVTYVDESRGGQGVKSIHEVNPVAVQVTGAEAMRHENRINTTYFRDLFLMLSETDRRQITAREVAERHEEKLQMLGPVLERLRDELLDPLIDRIFGILDRRGQIPPPPQEIQGRPLKVEYISILAQAQQAIGIQQVERFVGFVGSMAGSIPEVLDKVDADKVVDEYGTRIGIKPDLIRSADEVAEIRKARSEAQQQQAQTEQALAATEGAKTLADTNLNPENALGRILNNMGGGEVAAA